MGVLFFSLVIKIAMPKTAKETWYTVTYLMDTTEPSIFVGNRTLGWHVKIEISMVLGLKSRFP